MNNNRVMKNSGAVLYSMPSLDGRKGGRDAVSLEELQRKAYEEGFASGEKAGFAEGQQKAVMLAERLRGILEEMVAFNESIRERLESQVVELSLAIAKKIVMDEINTHPDTVLDMVRRSLKKLHRTGTITVRINPALEKLFKEHTSELVDIHRDIIFDVDANIPLAGPHISSQTEEIVTDIDSLLVNIFEEMTDAEKARSERPSAETRSGNPVRATPSEDPLREQGRGTENIK